MWLLALSLKGATPLPDTCLCSRLKEVEGNFKEEEVAEIKKAELLQKSEGPVHFYLIGQNCVMAIPCYVGGQKIQFFSPWGLLVNQVSVYKDEVESGYWVDNWPGQ